MSRSAQPRIPYPPREEWTDDTREVMAFWGEPNAWEEGSQANSIKLVANHPDLGKAFNVWGKHLLVTNAVPLRDRELIILRVAWLIKSLYEWHNHVGYALNLGMRIEEIAAVKGGVDGWNWSEQDRAVLKGVDELLETNDLSDATWAELSSFYDKRQMLDFVHTVGHYVMMGWALKATRLPLEDYADPIGWDLTTASGKTPRATQKPGESEDWAENRGYDN